MGCYQREVNDYNKNNIKSPADYLMKERAIYSIPRLETTIKNLIKWILKNYILQEV